MKRISTIIELEYDEEGGELSTGGVERTIARVLKTWLDAEGITASHIEAAPGSLKEAFGIEEYESQKVVLEAQLKASLKAKS